MDSFPELKRSDRTREFVKYSQKEIKQIVIAHLFKGLSHREIDDKVLNLNSEISRGFESMNVLHFLGLRTEHKRFFEDYSLKEALYFLKIENQNEIFDILNNEKTKLFIDNTENNETSKLNSELTTIVLKKEGKKTKIFTTKYERNPKLRQQALKIHGYLCSVCNFDFQKTYGEIGKGYIEVHHKKPLYTLKGEVKVDPKEDLAPVCSNCHRMLHRKKNKIMTIDDLKRLIRTSTL